MKNMKVISPAAVGGSSLLVIFAVLCMTVFALLSLSTAQAEKRMAEASYDRVVSYYEADLQAQTIFAQLRNGETVPTVTCSGQEYHYAVPFFGQQTLEVTLQRNENGWTILQWQTTSVPEVMNEPLPVWQGDAVADIIK